MERAEEIHQLARAIRQHLEGLRTWGLKDIPTRAPRQASSKAAVLAELEDEVIRCTRCPLYQTRTHPVLGEGSLDARLVFVGEAPGKEEDAQGRPFVGAAGQLLTKMIEAIGLGRGDVYICNVLKDRPPANRTPLPEEVEACAPFLLRQLAIIQPKVICTLGAVAAKALLGPFVSVTKIRGQMHSYAQTPVMPTFHPAYLLRNPAAKRLVWQDLKRVKALLERASCSVEHPAGGQAVAQATRIHPTTSL